MTNTLVRLFSKKRKGCKSRTQKACKTAKKTCRWASGSKRSFCRVKRNRRTLKA